MRWRSTPWLLNSSRAIGPAFAGLLIATIGVHGSYYVQAFMFVLATVWTIQMRIPERSRRVGACRPGIAFSKHQGAALST